MALPTHNPDLSLGKRLRLSVAIALGWEGFQLPTDDSTSAFKVTNLSGTTLFDVKGDGSSTLGSRAIGGTVSVLAANGTALTNSTDEAVLASYVVPANTIKAGTVIKVKFLARVTAEAGATTFTPRLRIGATTLTGTEVFVGSAVDADVNHIVTGEFTFVGRAAPAAAAAVVGVGSFSQSAAAGGAMISAALAATNFATNGALRIELTGDLSAADATSVRAEVFIVEISG